METTMPKIRKSRSKHSKLYVRGFIRGQLVNGETGKIEGDTGWIENSVTNFGLTTLALLLGGLAGSSIVAYAYMATQATAFNVTQTALLGGTNSFQAPNLTTSGTCTLQATASFASNNLGASCSVAAAGLYNTNSAGSGLLCGQTFATSSWNTNQNFNLTYSLYFAT
jgi:hypothetical protein